MMYDDPDLPDAGDGACCYGAAHLGAGGCTCWTPVYDLDQSDPVPAAPQVRDQMCGDCAYRPGSPEKQGDPGHAGDPESLETLAYGDTPFWCHDGMRRPVVLRHPSGAEVPGHSAAYAPPVVEKVPYRADGQPGLMCAGWAARRRALTGQDTSRG